jgi:DNA-binding NtrC family response regulator
LGSNVDIPVKVRLVSATNQNLEELARQKKFRDDLYFRLNVVRLELPPLRDRLADIPELAQHLMDEISHRHRLSIRSLDDGLIRRFQRYHWPGNIREMRNVLESILVLSPSRSVGVADLPSHILHKLRSSDEGHTDERSKILSVLTSVDWNRNEAARILSCSRMTLYRKIVKYSISTGARLRQM